MGLRVGSACRAVTIFARAPSAKAVLVSTCTAAEYNSAHAQSFAGPELQITVVAKESEHFLVSYFSHVIGVWSVSESFRSRTLGSVSKDIYIYIYTDKTTLRVIRRLEGGGLAHFGVEI